MRSLILGRVLSVAFLVTFVCATKAQATEVCATSAVEVSRSLEISRAVQTFGGIDSVLGGWKLAGLAGIFAKANVELRAEATNFTVKINEADEKRFTLCVDSAQLGALKLHVLKAASPDFAMFLLKPGQPGATIYGACGKSNWKFMKFKRPSK